MDPQPEHTSSLSQTELDEAHSLARSVSMILSSSSSLAVEAHALEDVMRAQIAMMIAVDDRNAAVVQEMLAFLHTEATELVQDKNGALTEIRQLLADTRKATTKPQVIVMARTPDIAQ